MLKPMRLETRRLFCLLLSLALALQPVTVLHARMLREDEGRSSARQPTSADQATRDEITPLLKKLHSLVDPNRLPERFDALEKFAGKESDAAFDVAAKAKELGKEVDSAFAFVRDAVRYEVYPGVLRGSRGTLMAMAGNSFDKSLLLAELLKEQGVNVRFVRGQLDSDRAEALVSQMFQQVRNQADRGAVADEDAPDLPVEFIEGSNAFGQLIVARWIASLESVTAALRSSKIGVAGEPPVSRHALVAEATDHCWIEVQRDETWTALDASFQDSEAGRIYASAANPIDALTPDAHQQVVIRLQFEQRKTSGLETTELLQYETTAEELHGAAVSLRHEIRAENSTWIATPVLRIEDVELRGEKISAPAGGLASGVNQLGGNLFNRAKGESIEQGITALWLDVDFIRPNGIKETVRRELFDRIGTAARNEKRAGKAPLTPLPANGLPPVLTGVFAFSFSNGTLHPGFSQVRFARQVPLMRKSIANGVTPTTATPPISADEQVRLLADSLCLLATSFHMRSKSNIQQAVSSGAWNDVWFYEAAPRLAIVHFVPASGEHAAENTFEIKIDLRRNDLRPVAANATGPEIIWANVSRGLLDAALEHVMFVDSAATTTNVMNSPSTIALVEHARQVGVEFEVVTSHDVLSQLSLPMDAKSRLLSDFHEPLALIAPAKAIPVGETERTGWWRVDLASGETLAVMDTGLHEGGMLVRSSDWMQDSVELGLMHYVQAIVVVGCMTVFPAVFAAWFWGEVQSQNAYRRGFNDGLNAATESMSRRYGVPDPRDGAIDYSVPPPQNR